MVLQKTGTSCECLAPLGMLSAPLYSDFEYLAGKVHSGHFANVLLLLSLIEGLQQYNTKEASPPIPTQCLYCLNLGKLGSMQLVEVGEVCIVRWGG